MIKIEVSDIQPEGQCSLSGKSGEVLFVTIADGTVVNQPLSVKSLLSLLRMKLQQGRASGNGQNSFTRGESVGRSVSHGSGTSESINRSLGETLTRGESITDTRGVNESES